MSNLIKKKLKIEGMYCTACAMTIDFDLEDLKGVKSVKTNYASQTTDIEFDERTVSLENILDQIKKTGYAVKGDSDH